MSDIISKLVNSISNFLHRDIIYIISGSIVVYSWLYCFELSDSIFCNNLFIYFYLISSYIVGYSIQEFSSLWSLVTTADFRPYKFFQKICEYASHKPWREYIEKEISNAFDDEISNKSVISQNERIIMLRLIGTSIGPCLVIASFSFFYHGCDVTDINNVDIYFGICLLLFGIISIIIGWVKGVQHLQYMNYMVISERKKKKKPMGITYVEGQVRGPAGMQESVKFLIDSGATYSLLPQTVWQSIGLEPKRKMSFTLADGTSVERAISEAFLILPQGEAHTPVILGEANDEALLGVVTLEILGLVFNPFDRSLSPMRILMC